jgi:hypothetical protein
LRCSRSSSTDENDGGMGMVSSRRSACAMT